LRGETSKELPKQGHAAVAVKGSSAPQSTEQERCAEMPAASAAGAGHALLHRSAQVWAQPIDQRRAS